MPGPCSNAKISGLSGAVLLPLQLKRQSMRSFGMLIGSLAVAVAVLTAAALPWLLGGVVPLARTVLLIGCLTAGILSVLANLSTGRLPQSFPLILLPVAGLALLGMWQLRPLEVSLIRGMAHAVSDISQKGISEVSPQGSLIPADTRSTIAVLVAASILSFVCFDRIRSSRAVLFTCGVLLLDAVAITTVGFTQLFHATTFELNEIWSLGGKDPFATFVNTNNAAGWLCLCFAVAAGCCSFVLMKTSYPGQHPHGGIRLSLPARCWQGTVRILADLTAWQILAVCTVAFLGAGIAATKSRGGILALLTAVAVTLTVRSSFRRLPLLLVTLAAGAVGIFGILHWFDLDRGVIDEMETLSDLQEAAGRRPGHWLDTLHAVRDFPISGTGLGSYRFANLPYQASHTGLWFRNADNQFVEIAVEGGLSGLLLFLAFGVCGLITGSAGWQQNRQAVAGIGHRTNGVSRRLSGAAGTTVVVATLTQAVSAVFDYGVALPAALAVLTIIISASAGILDQTELSLSPGRTGAIRCGGLVVLPCQICLLCAGAAFLSDQWEAAEIDKSVVAGNAIVTHPVTPEKLERLESERRLLQERLRQRPDDPEGLLLVSRLADAEFRRRLLVTTRGTGILQNPGLDMIWQRFAPGQAAMQLASLEQRDASAADRVRSQTDRVLHDTKLPEILEFLQQRFPLMPNIAEARAEVSILEGNEDLFRAQLLQASMVEPASAESLYRLGSLALGWRRTELAQQLWRRSSQLSTEYQAAIMAEATGQWSDEEVFELFGPRTYEACVTAAQASRNRQLKSKLFDNAEGLWCREKIKPTRRVELLRAAHLAATGRPDEAIAWMQDRVTKPGDHVELRRNLARLLEKQGQNQDALGEWLLILYLKPGDTEATAQAARLRNLK